MAILIIDPSRPLPPTHGDNENALDIEFGETVILKAGATVAAFGEGSVAISGLWDNALLIDGRVHSERYSAISIQGVVNVGATGSVTGAVDGVYLYGENEPGRPNTLINAGLVNGGYRGVRLEADENLVSNSGTIAGDVGVEASSSNQSLIINNTGLIKGIGGVAIHGALYGSNTVTNSGRIEGDVVLGAGSWSGPAGPPTHIYDGRGGTISGIVRFSAGNDVAYGGEGPETFELGINTNAVDGGSGIDTLVYGFQATVDLRVTRQQQTGWHARDTILNIENLNGSAFSDRFIGNGVANSLVGNAGNDTLDGYDGNDLLSGGAGNDLLVGGAGSDTAVFTGKFSDYTITPIPGGGIRITDNRATGDGSDLLAGVEFALFSDRIYALPTELPEEPGTPGAPPAMPSIKNLTWRGGSRADTFVAGKGHDTLNGGLGGDTLTGGAGRDTFAFTTKLGPGNVDRIMDFRHADDTIRLSKAVFGHLKKGWLTKDAFWIGAKAHDGSDRIIFNPKSGGLYYDADGSGVKHNPIKFAQLKANTLVRADDLLVV